jgi:large subunit ribosomal protein L25
MAKTHELSTLTLETRTETGTTNAHQLRRAGKIPGVVYGHGKATPITIDVKQLSDLLLSGHRSHVLPAKIGGASDSVLLRRIETDPISRKPLSVDFQRITKNEAIFATVQVVTVGTPAGVKDQGGVLDVMLRTLEIKGPAQSLPDRLEIDVTELGVHQHVSAGQVTLPKGFTLITPPDTIVAAVEITRAEAAEEGPTPAEAPAAAETPADASQG